MPDSQGFATKAELMEALRSLDLDGTPASERVRKVVACAGLVKAWASPEIGLDGALRLQKFLGSRPGVKAVTIVPEGE